MVKILFTPLRLDARQLESVASGLYHNDSRRAIDRRLIYTHPDPQIREEQSRRIVAGWLVAGGRQITAPYESAISVYGHLTASIRNWLISNHDSTRNEVMIWIYEPANLAHYPVEWLSTGIYSIPLTAILTPFFEGDIPDAEGTPSHVKTECVQLTLDDGGSVIIPRLHLHDSVDGELEGLEPGGEGITLGFKLVMMSQDELDALPEFEG